MIAVLDAWATLAVLRAEPAAAPVREVTRIQTPVASSINLGEALYLIIRERGEALAAKVIAAFGAVMRVEDPDWQLVRAAARLKALAGSPTLTPSACRPFNVTGHRCTPATPRSSPSMMPASTWSI